MKLGLLATLLVLAAIGTGCNSIADAATPLCTSDSTDPLVLEAQSVSTASCVPCIASYPAGWNLATVRIRSGVSSFTLDSDRAGRGALKVTLKKACETSRATEIVTDEPGTRRYEQIISVENGLRSTRTYVFDGGCVTYDFKFKEKGQALLNEASRAVDFLSRGEVDEQLHKEMNLKVHL